MACTRTIFIIDMHDASSVGSTPVFRLFFVIILKVVRSLLILMLGAEVGTILATV
jgi:hypothetical protein